MHLEGLSASTISSNVSGRERGIVLLFRFEPPSLLLPRRPHCISSPFIQFVPYRTATMNLLSIAISIRFINYPRCISLREQKDTTWRIIVNVFGCWRIIWIFPLFDSWFARFKSSLWFVTLIGINSKLIFLERWLERCLEMVFKFSKALVCVIYDDNKE